MNAEYIYQAKSQNARVKVCVVISDKLDLEAKSIIKDNKNNNKGRYKNHKNV